MATEKVHGSLRNGAYVEARVDDQIAWYDKKATTHKMMYLLVRFVELAAGAAIPFVVNFSSDDFDTGYIVSGLGLIVVITAGMLALFKYHDNWTNFRTTAETLKHQKFLYVTGARPYHRRNPFERFVKNIEATISKEHSQWLSYVGDDADDDNGKPE